MTVTHESSNMFNISSDIGRRHIAAALLEAGIAQQLDADLPELTENANTVLERRYLSKDREGNILEDSDGMFRRVAVNLSQADLNYGTF